MKRISIATTAWHYKLAQYGHLDEWDGQTDLCRYFWALVRGVGKAPLIAVAAAAGLYVMVVAPLMCVFLWVTSGSFGGDEFAVAGFGLWVMVGVLTVMIWLREKADAVRYGQSPPGILRSAYRGWKEKTCVLVDVGKP